MISYDMFHDFTLPVVSMVSFPHGLSDQNSSLCRSLSKQGFGHTRWALDNHEIDRKCWKTDHPCQPLAPLEHTEIDRIIFSILVLNIGFSKLCNPWSLLTVYYFQAVFRYLWATWLPLPTTQSRNCSNEYEWFVATSLFQSPCVSRVCLRIMSLKSSHPIALAASMYTCSWAMSAKRIASWKANSCCTFTSTRPSLSQLHGLSSSMTNDLLVQSTLDLWWMQQWKNNEASCHSSRFAKGCKEVNAAP